MMKKKQFWLAALVVACGAGVPGARVQAAEFGANTPYYEDDRWADITEWFDGNDYNPTDEAWWRWDDEVYEATEDLASDTDDESWFGFTAEDENDWYYDFYDPYAYEFYDYDEDDLYEFSSRFYDYNDDGIYDAYAWYSDLDADGAYEDVDYYVFADAAQGNQQSRTQPAAGQGREEAVTGIVQKTKLVKVPSGQQHVVVAIKPEQGQKQMLIADLGSRDALKNFNPKLGDTITVRGPKAKVGKQNIVLARSIKADGQTKQIGRDSRVITAKVLETKKTRVRGQEHLLAIVEPTQRDQARKVAVDLGPADRLKMDVRKGSTITFTGLPVKVEDRFLIMAQSVKKDGQFAQINRQQTAMGGPGGQQQRQGRQSNQP